MGKQTTSEPVKTIDYTQKNGENLIQEISRLNVDSSYYLILMVGKFQSDKIQFMKSLAKKAQSEIVTVDMAEVISTDEETSYKNIDKAFSSLSSSQKIVYLQNGDSLGGAYTGFSYSVERYATPQERYLLKTINESEKIVILDLRDPHTVNNTLKRNAQVYLNFDYTPSFMGKLKQSIKSLRLHGHTFESKRKALK